MALTTYHPTTPEACFPPATWPDPAEVAPEAAHRGRPTRPAAAVVQRFASQPHIERRLIRLVWHLVSPAARGVLVADRGFASADLFTWPRRHRRDFVLRIDAAAHVRPGPSGPGQPVAQALALRPGERRWSPGATSGQQARVPVHLLAV